MKTWKERLHHFNPEDRYRDELVGLIFDIQRFSVHDGPGIRTTVFLKGCPLRCLWCQNPESMSRSPEITHIETNCIRCNNCLDFCQEGAVETFADGGRHVDGKKCTLCGKCIEKCYSGAMNIFGRYLTVPELMGEVERDREFYERSGGGVTLSGGEPTAQPTFSEAACRSAQSRGLHVTIDTSGFVGWETFRSILRYVDLVLYDLKHMDSSKHLRLTGVPNELILENLKRIGMMGIPVRVRIPLVPGYNDSPENIRTTASFVSRFPNILALDILPYHRLGEPKWHQLGLGYKLSGVEPPTKDLVYELADTARDYDIEVNVGG